MSIVSEVPTVRPVLARDLDDLRRILAVDPVSHCFVASRVAAAGVDPWRLGGELLGYFVDERLESALYLGANLAPVTTDPQARAAFAGRLRTAPRRCSSFVGRAEEVLDLWRLLEPAWGPAREVRSRQPMMSIDREPLAAPDARVRRATRQELDLLLPACIDMFTGEVGVSPVAGGSTHAYRARIAEIVDLGRSFVAIEDGEVLFKAEVGAVAGGVCQVQGVWVAPRMRGRGISVPCLAEVVRLCRAEIAPVVSLYVNDFNTAARKAYRSTGFVEVDDFATVLF